MLPKYRAKIRLLQLGRNYPAILEQKQMGIFQMDQVFKEAFGSANTTWRSTFHRVHKDLDIDMNGEFFS